MRKALVRKAIFLSGVLFVLALLIGPEGIRLGAQSDSVIVNGREAMPGEALVKFRTPPPAGEVEQVTDADRNEGVGSHGLRRLHSRSMGTAALVAALARRGDVVYAEPNYVVRANVTTNDTYMSLLWGLFNTGQSIGGQVGVAGADISADQAWALTTGSRANVVGVVDTGVDYNHPDLAANIWSAPASFSVTIGGASIACAAGTHGFNAIARTCNPMDDNDHGTHVSGTIGAIGNNGAGVAGVNWTASVMGLKFLDATGSGNTADAINAIDFAIQAKKRFGAAANVRVLSASWGGGGFSQALLDEINAASANDMLFVAAAGNGGADKIGDNNDVTSYYPASYTAANVVAVAATDNRDNLASFSNYGASSVELGAPGVYIASTTRNSGYAYMSGTSMATPHVSGAAALTLAHCPSLTTTQLISTILGAVDPVASLAAKTSTGGRLNVYKALVACGTPASPDFSLSVSPASASVGSTGTVSFLVAIARTGGYTGTPLLSVSGLPTGATASFNPTQLSTSSTLTVSTSGVQAATYPLTITATDGSLVRTTSASLVVTAPAAGDFSLSTSPSSIAIKRGSSGTIAVSIARSGGFGNSVALSIAPLPARVQAAFNPNPATGSASTLTLTVASSASKGTTMLTITGTDGTLTRQTTIKLQVR